MPELQVKQLGMRDYQEVWQQMQEFTAERTAQTNDQLWLVEHNPVYTLGRNGKAEHVLQQGDIPLVSCDRGGQVTYHGPGQLVVYLLLDVRRLGVGVRQLVTAMEHAIIDLLASYDITSSGRADAPGVYVGAAKIAALGLRIRGGCSYHGLSLNVDMDLTPFKSINPCGYEGLEVTQLSDLVEGVDMGRVTDSLIELLSKKLAYSRWQWL